MPEPAKECSLTDIYLEYYNYVTNTNPLVSDSLCFDNEYYDDIRKYTEKLPSDLLLHVKDGDGRPMYTLPIDCKSNAERVWRGALGLDARQRYSVELILNNMPHPPRKPGEPVVWGKNWMSDLFKEKHDFEVSRVKDYLRIQHEEHLERLRQKPQNTPEMQGQANGQDISVSIPQGETSGKQGNIFRLNGNVWQTVYNGEEKFFKDTDGFRYIHHLIQHKGKKIHVSDLREVVANSENTRILKEKVSNVEFSEVSHDIGYSVLDDRAKKEYRERLTELQEKIKDAENRGSELERKELQGEYDYILKELQLNTNIKGRSRKLGDKHDADRVLIKKSISNTLSKIKEQNKELSEHLESSIETGFDCLCLSNTTWIT
ncbi:MAG: hypothetical protein HUU08_17380 [Candidatus Brocadia sp.]|nr:hypothetical protein [Candidatus Brocadia sp.]UJS18237.1 MAG: hypothetical protein L3J17_04035 [Candidatus Jettenia sp.]